VAFGDQQDDLLIDGAMASTAIPPFFPPWRVGDKRYLDGGVTSKLPLCMAIDRGATQIIALDVEEAMGSLEAATDVASIGGYSLSLMVEYQTRIEIERARARGVALRVFSLRPPPDLEIWDYTAAERLIELGRQQTLASLRAQPLVKASAAQIWIRRMMVNLLDRLAGNRKFGAEVNDSGRRD
jgi:NTE family protein